MSLQKSCNKAMLLCTLLGSTFLASGCATAGLIYEDVGHPPIHVVGGGDSAGIRWDPNLNASMGGRHLVKRGVACSQDILKLVAWGDATQAAAAKQGGITEVVGVDFDNTAVLGFFYTKNCTVVYGTEEAPPSGDMAPAAEAPEAMPATEPVVVPEPAPAPPPQAEPASPPAPGTAAPAPAPGTAAPGAPGAVAPAAGAN